MGDSRVKRRIPLEAGNVSKSLIGVVGCGCANEMIVRRALRTVFPGYG